MNDAPVSKGRVDDAYFENACRACRIFYKGLPVDPRSKKRPKDALRFLIALCIEEQANTESSIVGAIHSLGVYNPVEVVVTLKREAGLDRSINRWFDRGDGTYGLHENAFE